MKQLCFFILPALLCLSLTGRKQWQKIYFEGPAQGTSYHITYYAADTLVRQNQIDSLLAVIDGSMSLYQPSSLISRFNRGDGQIVPDEHLMRVVKRSVDIQRRTNGLFDMTIQPLTQLWGFGTGSLKQEPDTPMVKAALSLVGPDKIVISGNRLIKRTKGAGLDLNGIAQGYTVDVIAALLKKNGISNFLVEVGGELLVSGRKMPSGDAMRIGIESPVEYGPGQHAMQRILTLENGAITTSGSYRKFYERGGKQINHIINPKTGFPVNNELISVTVHAGDAMTADGYDQTLMLMGLKEAMDFVNRQNEISAYFIYKKPDGSVADTASAGFGRLLKQTHTR
ncbi:FAD:protein FMN transferase [Pedobacter sp. SYP-B3415]|uniref:FAD:protein FMN transferase n=1 Tax=Pedobacter sp. SYP-B3415 TaxID=2496641 RepID=UPI00101D6174|nr:FAD:protein FMN transferase [Pedobacter sp. SYP-B3415]